MKEKTLKEAPWGCLSVAMDRQRFDFIPRLTIVNLQGVVTTSLAFLVFSMHLTVLSNKFRRIYGNG